MGIYLFVDQGDGIPWLLVHRRSRQVSEPNMIAGPGGIVERHLCVGPNAYKDPDNLDFEAGAETTAIKELEEETGVNLKPLIQSGQVHLRTLPTGEGTFWGPQRHRNYCAVLEDFPQVTGPEKASRHEIVHKGLDGIGRPADYGWNAWVDVRELLARKDLMAGCRVPLTSYLEEAGIECDATPVDPPAVATPAPRPAPVVRPSPRPCYIPPRPMRPALGGLRRPGLSPAPFPSIRQSSPDAAGVSKPGLPNPAPVPIPVFQNGRPPLGCPPLASAGAGAPRPGPY